MIQQVLSLVLPEGVENLCPLKNLHRDICNRFIHNSQNLEATKMSFDRWLDKQTVVHPDNKILLSVKKIWRTVKAHYLMKEARLKRLHTVWFQLLDILERQDRGDTAKSSACQRLGRGGCSRNALCPVVVGPYRHAACRPTGRAELEVNLRAHHGLWCWCHISAASSIVRNVPAGDGCGWGARLHVAEWVLGSIYTSLSLLLWT